MSDRIKEMMTDPGLRALADLTLRTAGAELRVHRVVAAGASGFFRTMLARTPGVERVDFQQSATVVRALARSLYGFSPDPSLGPLALLELSAEARNLEIAGVDLTPLLPSLVLDGPTALRVLCHDETPRYTPLLQRAADTAALHVATIMDADNMPTLLGVRRDGRPDGMRRGEGVQRGERGDGGTAPDKQSPMDLDETKDPLATPLLEAIRNMPAASFALFSHAVAARCDSATAFCGYAAVALAFFEAGSLSELLRHSKQFEWAGDESSFAGAGAEWVVAERPAGRAAATTRVRSRLVEWAVRLDAGGEDKPLRLVYEGAQARAGETAVPPDRWAALFPCALFTWNVRAADEPVAHEKPVFIAFPSALALHWSTTLPLRAADVSRTRPLRIRVRVRENPLASLLLAYLAKNLHSLLLAEDLLNTLPHVEYRCLSAYSLYQGAQAQRGEKRHPLAERQDERLLNLQTMPVPNDGLG